MNAGGAYAAPLGGGSGAVISRSPAGSDGLPNALASSTLPS
jgi:hypothetical protein